MKLCCSGCTPECGFCEYFEDYNSRMPYAVMSGVGTCTLTGKETADCFGTECEEFSCDSAMYV